MDRKLFVEKPKTPATDFYDELKKFLEKNDVKIKKSIFSTNLIEGNEKFRLELKLVRE